MNNSRIRYEKIKTLADVRKERIRINRHIRRKTKDLESDAENIREMFSFGYIANSVASGLSGITGKTQWVFSGFKTAQSVFNKIRGRNSEKKRRKKEQNDQFDQLMCDF